MLVFDHEIHEFGKITEGDVVKHTFKFVNKGPGVVKLVQIKLSCGCTTAKTALKEYAPGEEGELKIRLDTAGKHGFILKSIEVHMENAVKDKIELAMTAELVPPPHPEIENVLLITTDPKCRTCHLEAGVGFKGGFLYHRICVQCHGRRGTGASARAFNVEEWQAGIEQRDREFLLEDTITGAVLLGLASLLFMNAAVAPVLVGIIAGALAGALASIVRGGTITTLCLGIPAGLLVLQYGFVSGRSAMLLMLSVCIGCVMIAQHRILRTT